MSKNDATRIPPPPPSGVPKARPNAVRTGPGAPSGRYRIGKRRWPHPLGEVFEAMDLPRGTRVTLTIVRPASECDPQALQSILGLTRPLAALGRPELILPLNIERLPPDRVAIVTETRDAQPLSREVVGRALPTVRTVGILRQVIHLLGQLHAAGLQHAALTVGSVLLESHGSIGDHVLLTDLGWSSVMQHALKVSQASAALQAISPERAVGAVTDAREDQYLVGCLAYTMFTGGPPFRTGDVDAVARRHAIEDPMPIEQRLRGHAPARALLEVVHRCLSKDPDERYPDMSSLGRALHQAQEEAGITTSWDDLGAPSRTTGSRRNGQRDAEIPVELDVPPIGLDAPLVPPSRSGLIERLTARSRGRTGAHPSVAPPVLPEAFPVHEAIPDDSVPMEVERPTSPVRNAPPAPPASLPLAKGIISVPSSSMRRPGGAPSPVPTPPARAPQAPPPPPGSSPRAASATPSREPAPPVHPSPAPSLGHARVPKPAAPPFASATSLEPASAPASASASSLEPAAAPATASASFLEPAAAPSVEPASFLEPAAAPSVEPASFLEPAATPLVEPASFLGPVSEPSAEPIALHDRLEPSASAQGYLRESAFEDEDLELAPPRSRWPLIVIPAAVLVFGIVVFALPSRPQPEALVSAEPSSAPIVSPTATPTPPPPTASPATELDAAAPTEEPLPMQEPAAPPSTAPGQPAEARRSPPTVARTSSTVSPRTAAPSRAEEDDQDKDDQDEDEDLQDEEEERVEKPRPSSKSVPASPAGATVDRERGLSSGSGDPATEGNALFNRGNFAEASRVLEQATRKDPRNADLHLLLGDAYYKLGKHDQAREKYLRAQELGHSAAARRLRKLTD